MTTALIILAGVLLLTAAVLLVRLMAENARQEKMVVRLRSTELYGHVYPMLRKYDNDFLESVSIRREGIIIRTLVPLGGEARFTFVRHGLDEPEGETLYALAQAVLVDMKTLRNHKRYRFRCHTIIHANGDKAEWYDYTVTPAWKGEILRAEARKKQYIHE
ncbi:MAG: hypothetical protein IKK21_10535 [Clostridia bacterium]|nr:hypothetical protein [Clostridia bacterium]